MKPLLQTPPPTRRTALAAWFAAAGAAAALELPLEPHGFVDARAGLRTQDDPSQDDESLAEIRWQLDLLHYGERATVQVRSDFLYDAVVDDHAVDLEQGSGWVDLREANLQAAPHQLVDVKVGRQILTWGTGDLLFINDLFPKDWRSFFVGRDEEYLKAPSDAALVSYFPRWADLYLAYTPRFDADRYIRGERISFFDPSAGRSAGQDRPLAAAQPDDWFDDHEIAARLARIVRGTEVSAYGYYGYWKSPGGFDPASNQAVFPELSVYGASLRGQAGPGILTLEGGYYDSREDRDGSDPRINNSEARGLIGYQRELARDLTAGVQYYVERLLDHDAYEASLPPGAPVRDENRHVLTLRVTQLLWTQDLTLSFFGYVSPSDEDAYLRPRVSYKLTDEWLATVGANVFVGREDRTFFGQFEDASNVYAGLQYRF